MKNILQILLCVIALFVLPLLAGESETKKAGSVEQRLLESDLSLAIRQYERVQMEVFEIRLKSCLLETDGEMTAAEGEKQEKLLYRRKSILEGFARDLRETALKLGEQLAGAKAK